MRTPPWKAAMSFIAFIATALYLQTATATEHEAVPGEFIVKLKQDVSGLDMKTMSSAFSGETARVVSKSGNLILVKRNVLELSSFSMADIAKSDMVEYVEPNYIMRAFLTPNDPRLPDLWGLINTGQSVGGNPQADGSTSPIIAGTPDMDIDADRAWDITTGSRDIVVAVIDTGVDYNIPDLAPNMWTNDAELNGEEGVDDDGNGFVDDVYGYDFVNNDGDPIDDHGHGSHCAGTIGAKGDDGVGVVGVAWNVRIMGVKFLSAGGSGTLEGAIQSIDYAAANGANIMSNSWGGGPRTESLAESIQRASDAGILFVAAAGNHQANNDETPTYPANYEAESVISVAAIDNNGQLASFSCYGRETVDVAAPGVEILSTTPDGFASWAGTSMATPHVSGVAALMWSHEPNLTIKEIKERIIATARPKSFLRNKVAGNGIVNAYHAITNTPAPIDLMDPYYWPAEEFSASSPHPYENGAAMTIEVRKEGAEHIAVHFSKFETEAIYDTVTFKDAEGNIVGKMSGAHNDSFSPSAPGDTMIIEFSADASVTRYGFDIDGIAFRMPAEEEEVASAE